MMQMFFMERFTTIRNFPIYLGHAMLHSGLCTNLSREPLIRISTSPNTYISSFSRPLGQRWHCSPGSFLLRQPAKHNDVISTFARCWISRIVGYGLVDRDDKALLGYDAVPTQVNHTNGTWRTHFGNLLVVIPQTSWHWCWSSDWLQTPRFGCKRPSKQSGRQDAPINCPRWLFGRHSPCWDRNSPHYNLPNVDAGHRPYFMTCTAHSHLMSDMTWKQYYSAAT